MDDGTMCHHLRIVHGSPTNAELAAVTALLGALAHGGEHMAETPPRPARRAGWDHRWRPHPAPHSWRAGAPRPSYGRP
ncbi:acyl-CoA carboxylase subunit epsilon [Streptomyces somaliensis]|uniref:Acyl-CoA carboxylase subunit epsilon n=1 Tax=Streptomyces somaliensis (strain ATCC 33201 / DSM 40738 / JCM 12659 / KCTC 9044 / NCTC 11332 / NRRL B-12077 / IP 733) TaxID=1134445 RepID=A0AA44DDS7_STRE0|nr:acyl-CoA carboxylase subunit epsilon [Streptomyces somaliensis]NKY15076.1 acyl-CoA carboxylase subunit epsilon [Streptomyces somaliensis DSM 40738]